MPALLLALILAAVCTSYSQNLVPDRSVKMLSVPPTQINTSTPASTVLLCGVFDTNVIAFNSSWSTPGGETIDAFLTKTTTEGQFIVRNAPLELGSFKYVTTLTITKLSYTNAGSYTCTASYLLNETSSNLLTGSSNVELQLSVSADSIATPVRATAGTSGMLSCEMARYIHPDSAFMWRRKGDVVESGGRFQISHGALQEGRAQNGGEGLTSSRQSTLEIANLAESDAGMYTCFVSGADASADVELIVELTDAPTTPGQPITASTANPNTVMRTDEAKGSSFPIPAVGAIAGFLGLVVIVLILLILLVSCRKRRKSSTVILAPPRDRELNENTAYESSSSSSNHAGGGSMHSRPLPKYAIIDKRSASPPPPLPARPSTNLSMCAGNISTNSALDLDRTPPGYDTPGHVEKNHSITIDPYYDNPDDVRPPVLSQVKKKVQYDEVELEKKFGLNLKPEGPFGASTVPSPATILSGSLKQNIGHPSPDFTYPRFGNEVQNEREHDYDQIYSEPLDPTIIRQDFEFENNEDVPIPYSAIYDDPQPFQDTCAPLRITPKNIVEMKELGMGQFGHVILAKTVGLSMRDLKLSDTDTDQSKNMLVAIKKLRTDADGCLMEAFDKEVKFMARLNHDNVIRLLGVCTAGESFIMMEYMENGDLNQFLTKQVLMPDTIAGLQDNEVTPIILLYIGVQIASGLHYLSSQRFVHRDLATRNCLVGRDFIVKISDFGMSRSLYESAYYRVQGTLVLPIRWMACETFYGKFSVKSDAWAFGVTLWEIYTLGKVDPYDNMTDEEVIADAIRGQDRMILTKPPSCPQNVYDIMQRCWVHEPSMRADFGGSLGSGMMPTSANESTSTNNPPVPLQLVFGFVLIGTLLMFTVILISIAAICFLSRRKREKCNTDVEVREKYTPTAQVSSVEIKEPRKASYSKVVKRPAISDNCDSSPPPLPPIPKGLGSSKRIRPHEIVTYDCEISKNFLPYAPPPPVHGLTSTDNHIFTSSNNPYNIQVESLADYDEVDSMEGSQNQFSTWNTSSLKEHTVRSYCDLLSPKDTDSYYDTVETVENGVMDIACSQQRNTIHSSLTGIDDGHYQSPRRNRSGLRISDANSNQIYTEHLDPSMLFRPSISSDESEALPYGPIYASPKTLKRSEKPLEISYHNISEIQSLGFSRFGDVVLAATVNLSLKDLKLGDSTDTSRSFLVAIKKLKINADWDLKSTFYDEIKCMMSMKHANVVRLLGICSIETAPFSMMEYMENGDLQEFLLKQKLVPDNTTNLQEGEATPLILLYMAVQIASGMRFLASRKFIHRDLAARNCLVGREFVVKIAEFGMSRSFYNSYYFRIQGQLILPIRWMSYESFYGKFSTKSDVWSFGVTLWEIYCMAECKPYFDMTNEEVINDATKGSKRSLLEKPRICPDEVFDVMKRCWVHEPSMRADFEEIYSRLFLAYTSRSQKAV